MYFGASAAQCVVYRGRIRISRAAQKPPPFSLAHRPVTDLENQVKAIRGIIPFTFPFSSLRAFFSSPVKVTNQGSACCEPLYRPCSHRSPDLKYLLQHGGWEHARTSTEDTIDVFELRWLARRRRERLGAPTRRI